MSTQEAKSLLDKLAEMRFWGKFTVSMKDGKVFHMEKYESIKPKDKGDEK